MATETATQITGQVALVFIPNRLANEMQTAGIESKAQLAQQAKIHRNSLTKEILAGEAEATPKTIKSIARALQVHPGAISKWGWLP